MDAGKLLQRFTYRPLTWQEHYGHIWMFECLLIFLTIGGVLFRGFGWDWFLIGVGALSYINIDWIFRLKEENSLTTFSLYENGIMVHIHKRNNPVEKPRPKRDVGDYWYAWSQVKRVRLISPYDRVRKGIRYMDRWEARPGIELEFSDGFTCMVYQRKELYGEPYEAWLDELRGRFGDPSQPWYGAFYQCLRDANVPGVEDRLPVYDRLSVHGQHKDGRKSEFMNNGGKPASYIDIT